jgi:prophage antirepressor-like protein
MDLLKIFKLCDGEHEINIQGTIEEPLFQANQIATILEMKNIRTILSGFDERERLVKEIYTIRGRQKATFLTEVGLYRLISRSNKPIAKPFQKWVMEIVREIRKNGVYKLNKTNEIDKKLLEHQNGLKINEIFAQTLDNKNVVYLCKIKETDNKILIKIGSSQNIADRISKLSTLFSSQILLLHVLQSDNYVKFEKFLHNHEYIKKLYIPTLMKSNTNSKETYLVSNEELEEIKNIMNTNRHEFNDDKLLAIQEMQKQIQIQMELQIKKENILLKQKEIEVKIIEAENKKMELQNNIISNINIGEQKDEEEDENENEDEDEDEDEDDDEIDNLLKTCNYELKPRKSGSRTPIIYKYSPDELKTPIKIYDSPIDVERDFPLLSPSQLKRAAAENTIYKNFRWLFLKRCETPPEQLPETKIIKHMSPDVRYIAMIDIKKTKILEVFTNQKIASEARNLKSNSGLTRAIKQYSLSSGHYWKHFDDCPEEMKQEYLANHKLPPPFTSPTGKIVEQIDPATNKVIETYYTNRDVVKKFQMSILSLKNASANGTIHHGYKWRIVDKAEKIDL